MANNEQLINKLIRKFNQLQEVRKLNEKERLEAMALADHRTKTASRSPSPVPDIHRHTAVGKNAIDSFVNYFQGNLVSPNMPWLSIRYEANDLTDQDDMGGANEYLGKLQKAVSSEFASSNFYPEHRLSCKDEYVGATSAILVRNDEDRNICVYETLTPWEYWVDTDQFGEYDTLFVKKTMSIEKAYEMFGDKLPKWMIGVLENGDPYQTYHDFLLCIYPRKKIYSAKRTIFAKEKKFAVVWIALQCAIGKVAPTSVPEIIEESGLDYFPAVVSCWDRDGDNQYGTSPVIRNASELKKADALSYETVLSIQKINHPAYAGVAQSMENFSDDPEARNIVGSPDLIPQALQVNQTVDGAMALEQKQENAIEKMFNNDLFSYLSRADNNKVYTATQVNAVKAEQLSLLSAVYGNFQKKIEKLVKLTIQIMADNGRLPEGSAQALSSNGKIRVVIDSTLAQELKAYTNRDANIALLEQCIVFHNIGRDDALMNFDFNEIARGIGFGMGVDYKVIKDKTKVVEEQIQQQQIALAMQQQQMELTASEVNRNNAGASNLNNATGANQYGA